MNRNENKSLNNILVKIGIIILLIILIVIIVFSFFAWQKTKDLLYIIVGLMCSLGTLFNIYLLSKEKFKKKEWSLMKSTNIILAKTLSCALIAGILTTTSLPTQTTYAANLNNNNIQKNQSYKTGVIY